jgi:Transcription termination factor nusG
MPMLESRSRRKSVSLVPLFPQYLFARLGLVAHYFEIRYMPGVVGFISTGGEVLAVAQTIVDNIRSRCRDGVVQIPRRPFQHGQHVRIVSGPFCDFDAIFEGYLSGKQARCDLDHNCRRVRRARSCGCGKHRNAVGDCRWRRMLRCGDGPPAERNVQLHNRARSGWPKIIRYARFE